MENIDDFFTESNTKTSPIHRPNYDFEFPFSDFAIQSPISTPLFDPLKFHDRFVDFNDQNLILNSNFDVTKKNNIKNNSKGKNKKLRNPKVFHPFVSFEATELTVHQLRATLNTSSIKSEKEL